MDLGYARVSTTAQDLDRQIDALTKAGIPAERIYTDKRTGSTFDRDGWRAVTDYARPGDVIVAYTLDRIGRNLRDCLNVIHDLRERGIGIRTLKDPLPIDTADDSAMGGIAVALLGLFAEMERTFMRERAAHAREVAEAKGKPTGRPKALTPAQARSVRAEKAAGRSVAELVAEFKVSRASIYRALGEADPVAAKV